MPEDHSCPENRPTSLIHKVCLHGLAVEVSCTVGRLVDSLNRLLAPFAVLDLPAGFRTRGSIQRFEQREVLRHLSANARRLPYEDPWLELYQDGERFWLLDERWGMAEINPLKGQWRSWILDGASLDGVRLMEGAVLWPMAQLLRHRGLHLVPAAAIEREGWGVLLLAGYCIEPELSCLLRAGYRIIGQRWTALRCDEDHLHLLRLPGEVERFISPRPRLIRGSVASEWADLSAEFPAQQRSSAFCDAVLIVDAGRRTEARAINLSAVEAQEALRWAWPITDLPACRPNPLPLRMSQVCRCVQVQLSRKPEDLLGLLESLRTHCSALAPRISVSVRGGCAEATRQPLGG